RRRQRGFGGGRRRRADPGLAHGRQCRPARRRLPRLLPGRRHQGARATASTAGARATLPGEARPVAGPAGKVLPAGARDCVVAPPARRSQPPVFSRAACVGATEREDRSWKSLKVAVSVAPSASPPRVSLNQFSGVTAKAAEGTAAHPFPCSLVSIAAPIP